MPNTNIAFPFDDIVDYKSKTKLYMQLKNIVMKFQYHLLREEWTLPIITNSTLNTTIEFEISGIQSWIFQN